MTKGTTPWLAALAFTGFLMLAGSAAPAQDQASAPKILLHAKGTGRTTGHIITLTVANPTDRAIEMRVGRCFVPSADGSTQGYVIPGDHPVRLAPLQATEVDLMGYCVDVELPPVPAGMRMTPVDRWITWQEGMAWPATERELPEAFRPRSTPWAPGDLTWPGSDRPFTRTLDIHRNPREAVRLLLHFVDAITESVETQVRVGRLSADPAEREGIVQQTLWLFSAQLKGRGYGQDQFRQLYTQQWRELRNDAGEKPPQSLETRTDDIWQKISLTGNEAKLLPMREPAKAPSFLPEASGAAADPRNLTENLLRESATDDPLAGDRLAAAATLLKAHPEDPGNSVLLDRSLAAWRSWLERSLRSVYPASTEALEELLSLQGQLTSFGKDFLEAGDYDRLLSLTHSKMDGAIRTRVISLRPDDPRYIETWRRLRSWQDMPWYSDCCSATFPLRDLLETLPQKLVSDTRDRPVPLTGPGWKLPAPLPVVTKTPFRWWIPAAAVPVAGVTAWLLLRDQGGENPDTPPAPRANDDALTLPCGGERVIDPLANDTGAGIALLSLEAPAGISAIAIGDRQVRILAAGTGTFPVPYTIRDSLGRQASARILVTVTDQQAPTIACPPDITLPEGSSLDPDLTGKPQVSDDCTPTNALQSSQSDTQTGGPCGPVQRVWTVTDQGGNTASCIQTILLSDETSPAVECPPGMTLAAGTDPDPVITGNPSATDNCAGSAELVTAFTDQSEGSGCDRTIQRTWTVSDPAGNAITCMQTIRFEDQDPPQITCPEDGSAECSLYTDTGITGMAVATDDCSPSVTLAFSDTPSAFSGCEGQVIRIWTATDAVGLSASCQQVLTVRDELAPDLTYCPPDITVELGQENELSITGTAQASDQCQTEPPPAVAYEDDLTNWSDCGGTILRKWTATDLCGNSADPCVQQVSAASEEPPTILCPENTTVECGQETNLALTGTAQGADACGQPLPVTFSDGSTTFDGCSGQLTRTWTASDPGGKSASCTQVIGITDNLAPQFLFCPPAVTVECGQQGNTGLTGLPVVADACIPNPSLTFTDDPAVFSGCAGTILRSFTAVDLCGNMALCVQPIFVQDLTPPVITCPTDMTVQCGQQDDIGITGMAMASDACSANASISFTDHTSGFSNCAGLIIRTFTAQDGCGNLSTCPQQITVFDLPCAFVPIFSVVADECGRCFGGASVSVSPPGAYTIQWDNGGSGPSQQNLCSGPHDVTITDQAQGCSDLFTVVVPEDQELDLVVNAVVQPSGFGASDGAITLEVLSGVAVLPFQVIVNGAPIGFFSANPFTISNLPVGQYAIRIRDEGGQGCFSNEVTVLLFVIGKPEGPDLLLPLSPLPQGIPLPSAFPLDPEHTTQSGTTGKAWMVAGRSGGITLPLSPSWRLGIDIRSFRGLGPTAGAAVPLEGRQLLAGMRYGIPLRSGLHFYQEASLGLQQLQMQRNGPGSTWTDVLAECGGGLHWRLSDAARLEAFGRLSALPAHTAWVLQAGLQLRYTVPLHGAGSNPGAAVSKSPGTMSPSYRNNPDSPRKNSIP